MHLQSIQQGQLWPLLQSRQGVLQDSAFKFLSSYYFTLFETKDATANFLSQDAMAIFLDKNVAATKADSNETVTTFTPTLVPLEEPTMQPTNTITNEESYSQFHDPQVKQTCGKNKDPRM